MSSPVAARLVSVASNLSGIAWRVTAGRRHEPGFIVAACAVVHFALWGAVSGALAQSPPDDSLEQVLLSQELRLEYGKHPPLPTWILYAVGRLFGPSLGATYVLGALCAVLTIALLYRFATPLLGAPRAALAAVIALDIEYMSAGTSYFNHNTVQLPLAVLAIAMFHRALTQSSPGRWIALGLAGGAMLLAKFSAVILFASFAAYIVLTGRWRNVHVMLGLTLATVVAAIVVAPYCLAVRSDAWSPNAYAMNSLFPSDVKRIECLKTVWGFASSQVAKVAPALLIFFALRRASKVPRDADSQSAIELTPFLTIVGFGPMVLTVVVAALSGAYLLVGWGTTFHVLLTVWLVGARPFAIEVTCSTLRKAAFLTVALQALLWATMIVNDGRLPSLNHKAPRDRPTLPIEMTSSIESMWSEHCAAPLRIVLADAPTGSALAVRFRGQPRVIDVTRPEHTKFFPPQSREADGALVVRRVPIVQAESPSTREQIGTLMSAAAWRRTVALAGADGIVHRFELGVLAPLTGPGCEYETNSAH